MSESPSHSELDRLKAELAEARKQLALWERRIQVEASLDRVQAEIASMRTTADLERITPLVWRELTELGVPFFRCALFIINEEAEVVHVYLSTPDGSPLAALHLDFETAPLVHDTVEHWRAHKVYTDLWDRKRFIEWQTSMLEQGFIKYAEQYQGGENAPERLALQFVPFTQGMLYVGSAEPLSESEIELVQTLADTFAVAYARYQDFQEMEVKNQALDAAKTRVEAALRDLKETQSQLVQSEKMASLGQMTAGIAHEIKNPLNFVNNFAELNAELADEILEELEANPDLRVKDVADILQDIRDNAGHIARHGKRADNIVHSMMQHASGGTGTRQMVAVNSLVEEYVNLAYHGMRAQNPGGHVEIERSYGDHVTSVQMMGQEMGRVILNLLNNAFYALLEYAESQDESYTPTVRVSTRTVPGAVEIEVSDNGPGIPPHVREKIFEPFFSTKPTGSGTGLGLSLSYDIITQGHGGSLEVESVDGKGATFTITLPEI